MIFFTADLHISHSAVIRYSNRPFSTTQDMDRALIDNWNSVIRSNDDHIYFIGDLSFTSPGRTLAILNQLNGTKYWIFGNHDKKLRNKAELLSHFVWAKDLATIKVPDEDANGGKGDGFQRIVMCHYPMLTWEKSHYLSWSLHGHSHNSLPYDRHSLRMDVGVDGNDYKPVSYQQVKEYMSKKSFKPLDHHKPRH